MIYGATATGKLFNESDIFIEMVDVNPVSKKIELINSEIRDLDTQIEKIKISKSYRNYKLLNDFPVSVAASTIVTCALLACGVFLAIFSTHDIAGISVSGIVGALTGLLVFILTNLLASNPSLRLEKLKNIKQDDKTVCQFVDTFKSYIQDPTDAKLLEIFVQFSKYPLSRISFPYTLTEPFFNLSDCRDILNLQILKQVHFALFPQKIETKLAIFSLTQEAFISEICQLTPYSLNLFQSIGLPMPSTKAISYFFDNHAYMNGIGSFDQVNMNYKKKTAI
jgi:hypothetical protein